PPQPLAQLLVLRFQPGAFRPAGESRIVFPPVEADLLGLVDGADEEPNLDREKLDVGEIHLDIARDHQSLIQNPIENVDQALRAAGGDRMEVSQESSCGSKC